MPKPQQTDRLDKLNLNAETLKRKVKPFANQMILPPFLLMFYSLETQHT